MVFSINTLAGFGCSIGMNMGYNKGHHQHGAEQAKKSTEHDHHNHHNEAPKQTNNESSPKGDHEDCCGDVTKLNLADKSVVSSVTFQAPIFLIAFTSHFLLPEQNAASLLDNTTFFSLRRSWSLHDHTDLRIVIQSFQI